MEKIPLVSIIIVNYNGKTHLEECLSSLEKIDYKNYEIILVDNNSTDTSVEYVKNSLIIRLTNFETGLATTSIFKTLGVILFRKSFGIWQFVDLVLRHLPFLK